MVSEPSECLSVNTFQVIRDILGFSQKICAECKNQAVSAYHFRQMCISTDELIRFNRKPPNNNNEHDYSVWNNPADDYFSPDDDFSEYLSGTKDESMSHSLLDSEAQQTPSIDETQNFDAALPSKKKRRYTCPVCGKLWVTPSKLSRHMSVHKHVKSVKLKQEQLVLPPVVYKKQEMAQCPICCVVLNSAAKLKQHMLIHVKTEPRMETKTVFADQASSSSDSMPIAQKVGPSYVCTVCMAVFLSSAKLNNHMKNQHMRKVSIISKSSSSSPKVPDKMTFKARSHRNYCQTCCRDFPTPYKLNRHLVTHSRPKKPTKPQRPRKYKCSHCEKRFETPSKVLRHQNVHRAVKQESAPFLEISTVTSMMDV